MIERVLVRIHGNLPGLVRESEGAMRCLAGLTLMQELLEGQTGGRRMRMGRGQGDGRPANGTEQLRDEQEDTEERGKTSPSGQARSSRESRGGGTKNDWEANDEASDQ